MIEYSFDKSGNQIYWRPSIDYINNSNLKFILQKYNITYDEFFNRSINNPEWFWNTFLDEINFFWFKHFDRVLDLSAGKQFPNWFIGGKTNWVFSALYKWATLKPQKPAVIYTNESRKTKQVTYKELLELTERIIYGLFKKGAKKGDRIGVFMSMNIEVVATFLAISALGGIVIPLFSGFGVEPIVSRLSDAQARFLFAQKEIMRKGKKIDTFSIIEAVVKNTPSVEKIFVLNLDKIEGNDKFLDFNELLKTHKNVSIEGFDSYTPFMLIYTSGTTGKPKAAVHTHTGFPIKSAQDMFHLFDVKENDRVFWLTDLGWMMGPWLICGTLLLGATVVLYDGAPDCPKPDNLWEVIEENQVSICGISPTFVRSQMAVSNLNIDKFKFPHLRVIGSTGEPWNPAPWQWTIDKIGKGRCPIINYSGGTEISGGILGCTVIHPLKPTSFSVPVPGIDADVFNEEGISITNEVGFLVVKNVNPGMTRSFWHDDNRYLETYWSKFDKIWFHHDLAMKDKDCFWYILGRADDTIKVAGKRIGPAELESAIVKDGRVLESAFIGIPDQIKGEVPVGFVVLKDKSSGSQNLKNELQNLIANNLGKSFIAKEIYFVADIPKTRNAKVMRRLIRAIYLNQPLGDTSGLENPHSLELIKNVVKKQ